MSDLAAIESYLALLAKHGVKTIGQLSFDGNNFPPVEMHDRGGAIEGAIVPKAYSQNAPFNENKCACGHETHAHDGQGACLLGCNLDVCARTAKT